MKILIITKIKRAMSLNRLIHKILLIVLLFLAVFLSCVNEIDLVSSPIICPPLCFTFLLIDTLCHYGFLCSPGTLFVAIVFKMKIFMCPYISYPNLAPTSIASFFSTTHNEIDYSLFVLIKVKENPSNYYLFKIWILSWKINFSFQNHPT